MKKIFITLMLAVFSAGFAQERFIEVAVSDTIVMKTVAFKYNVFVVDEDIVGDTTAVEDLYTIKSNQELDKQKQKSLKDFLIKKGYKPQESEDDGSGIFGGRNFLGFSGLMITVKTKAEADKLDTEIKKLGYAGLKKTGNLYGDESVYDNPLLKKVLERARKKAEQIALLGGVKLGRVLSVKEGAETDTMSALLKLRSAMDGNSPGIKSSTLTVRYEAL